MMMAAGTQLQALQAELRAFSRERDWGQFHTPKNLAMALGGEVGELLEQFQWLTAEESTSLGPDRAQAVAEELADIFIYLARLCDVLDIDLFQAAADKLAANDAKYPADKARGRADKYTEL
jgi:dCTP diphosphatase